MKYRADIDGLRAISVIAVIFFHSGFNFLSGGYIGVDIFFVISGYLITELVFNEIKAGKFTFKNFYKRRISRLLPALNITLLIVLIFGFLFYDNASFDSLCKEIFFSALGAANILFGQGVNYFAQDEAVRPLIHLWSLGVEEQFYLFWPAILMLLASLKLKKILPILIILFFTSFVSASATVETAPLKAYFYIQYRAFELIIGGIAALVMRSRYFEKLKITDNKKEIIGLISIPLIIIPMFLFDNNSDFLKLGILAPCLGTALFIMFAYQTTVSKLISSAPLVFLGLISYPLYLYHQPIISYLRFFKPALNNVSTLFIVLFLSIPLSWLTFNYIEKPIRKKVNKKDKKSKYYLISLLSGLFFFAFAGAFVAKNEGFNLRFKLLNPFAYQVNKQYATTFHTHFKAGINISKTEHGKILFIGDSLLQQYVYPFMTAFNIDKKDVDTVTKGGCIFLKGVRFQKKFSDTSCNKLRNELYKSDKHYDYIVISQAWDFYDGETILNFGTKNSFARWGRFINETIEHFKPLTKNIIIIGVHPTVEGTSKLKATIFLSEKNYRKNLNNLKVTNLKKMIESEVFFNQWKKQDGIIVINPIDIWHNGKAFALHNKKWSFFRDRRHISTASLEYVAKQLMNISNLTESFTP